MNTRLVHVHFYIHTLNLSGRFRSPLAGINTAINVKFLEKDYREQLTHTGLFLACVAGAKRGGVISMPFALPTNTLSTPFHAAGLRKWKSTEKKSGEKGGE